MQGFAGDFLFDFGGSAGGERPCGAPVAFVRFLARFDRRQIQPDDVLRVSGEQLRPEIRPDDVIRRGDDGRQVVDQVTGVAERSERADRGHGPESYDSRLAGQQRGNKLGGIARPRATIGDPAASLGTAAGSLEPARPPSLGRHRHTGIASVEGA